MTRPEIRATVLTVLAGIAPEVDPAAIADDVPLRDQVDIDSMDFLNFLIGVHEQLGVDIAESDYDQVETVAGLIGYIDERLRADDRR
jgi:acyl carrier protein